MGHIRPRHRTHTHQAAHAVPEDDVPAVQHRGLPVESQCLRRGPLLRRQHRRQVLEHQEPDLAQGLVRLEMTVNLGSN